MPLCAPILYLQARGTCGPFFFGTLCGAGYWRSKCETLKVAVCIFLPFFCKCSPYHGLAAAVNMCLSTLIVLFANSGLAIAVHVQQPGPFI